ncbi:hypothetical protein ACFL59_06460 [Planctomycetota bacterium]
MSNHDDTSMTPILIGVLLALLLLGGGLFLCIRMRHQRTMSADTTARVHMASRNMEAEARRGREPAGGRGADGNDCHGGAADRTGRNVDA